MIEPQEPTLSDLSRLQMENELLNLEVGHLRARLKTSDEQRKDANDSRRALARTRRRLQDTRRRLQALQKRHDATVHDMRRLLRRLDGSPARPLLRRWKGFRVLLAKYASSSKQLR